MSIQSLRSSVEQSLNKVDPVGAKLRKLRKRITALEAKKKLSVAEYKEMSKGWPRIAELQNQRNDFIAVEAKIDRKAANLIRLSKNYDKLAEQYDTGKIEEEIFEETLRKMQAKLQPPMPVLAPSDNYNGSYWGFRDPTITGRLGEAMEQAAMAVVIIFIIIPALFACSAWH